MLLLCKIVDVFYVIIQVISYSIAYVSSDEIVGFALFVIILDNSSLGKGWSFYIILGVLSSFIVETHCM